MHRALVHRVVSSATFRKSRQISRLLSYLCEKSLEGRSAQITEQAIGMAVFERQENYDSANDGIVRTQVSRLRSKLDQYFVGEGSAEPIVIVIAKGGYVPRFVPRTPESHDFAVAELREPLQLLPKVLPEPVREPGFLGFARGATWVKAMGLLLLLSMVALSVLKARYISRADNHTHPLWSEIFSPGQATLVVPADSTMVFWQRLTGHSIDLGEYIAGRFRDQDLAEYNGQHFGQGRYTSIVDLEIVSRLTQMAIANHSVTQIRYARDLRPNDLKQGNIVLIGTNETNPWVHLFENDMNFVFSDDLRQELYSVLNRAPQATEPERWTSSAFKDKEHWVYGVVALRSNLSGSGKVLILEGTSMAGTECAWDFASDDSQLLPFLARIRRANGHVPNFELLLGSHNMGGSAVKSRILAWRVDH